MGSDDQPRSEIDSLIATFYSAFDNRHGARPAAATLYNLFAPHACITRVSPTAVDHWTVQEFIAPRIELLTSGALVDFHEWEIEAETTVLAHIASRHSRYRKTGIRDGARFDGEGHKLIHLCRAGDRWLITSVLWEDA